LNTYENLSLDFDTGGELGIERRGPRARENLSNYRSGCRNLLPSNVVRGEPPLWIAIQKGKEPIEISLAWNAKVESHPKVGNIVTVHYLIGSDAQVAAGAWTKS